MSYGAPFPVIPLGTAAAAAGMTRAELQTALAGKAIIVGPNRIGVRPADLDSVVPGASTGIKTCNPSTDGPFVDGVW